MRSLPFVVGLVLAVGATVLESAPIRGEPSQTYAVYLPLVERGPPTPPVACPAIPGASYGQIPIVGPLANPRPALHPDINLTLRSWTVTSGPVLGLVTYNASASTDPKAPQLWGLFGDGRVPTIRTVYQVYDWNWAQNRRGSLITTWPVTLAGFGVQTGEIIQTPPSGYAIGRGFTALVLYAAMDQITLEYTGNDGVASGYALHIEGICVEPSLLGLFQSLSNSGSTDLPGLSSSQPIGRANGSEIGVSIRDTGSFMDPRSHNDWWQGK